MLDMLKKKWGKPYLFAGLTILLSVILNVNVFGEENVVPKRDIFSNFQKDKDEPEFVIEGNLTFHNKENRKIIIQIDIEVADTPYEILTGLMYRHSMPDTAGMLFIYKQSQQLFFWMKNTYIPLDIIFVNENMQIVTLWKNTKPLSEKTIPSNQFSKYVVEVNAGFCDKYDIKLGDYITYRIN